MKPPPDLKETGLDSVGGLLIERTLEDMDFEHYLDNALKVGARFTLPDELHIEHTTDDVILVYVIHMTELLFTTWHI